MAMLTEGLQNLEGPFSCTAERIGDDVVVTIRGELDLATRDAADEVLREAEEDAVRAVVIDLRELEFLGSTGLAMLIGHAARAAGRGVDTELIPSDGARRLLQMTGVDGYLTLIEAPPPD